MRRFLDQIRAVTVAGLGILCTAARPVAESLNEPLADPENVDSDTINGALAETLNDLNNATRAELPWVQLNLGGSVSFLVEVV